MVVRKSESLADVDRAALERRSFLTRGGVLAGVVASGGVADTVLAQGAASAPAAKSPSANLPPNVPEWWQQLGAPTASPYGKPSRFETAAVWNMYPGLKEPMSAYSTTPLQELDGTIHPQRPVLRTAPRGHKGKHEMRGIAWSGHGKIAAVDVSVDGGNTWTPATLQKPVLSKALTAFRAPFEWRGEELTIMSRAKDETGYVQPTIAQLLTARESVSFYHNNSIQPWKINKSGEVTNGRA